MTERVGQGHIFLNDQFNYHPHCFKTSSSLDDLLFHYWPAVPLTENNSLFWTIQRCVNQLSIILQKKKTVKRPALRYPIINSDSNGRQSSHHFPHGLMIAKLKHHRSCGIKRQATPWGHTISNYHTNGSS